MKKLYITIDRTPIEVSEEVYIEYHKMERRERYLEERDTSHGRVRYADLDTEETNGEDSIPDLTAPSVEEAVLKQFQIKELNAALAKLTADEGNLVQKIFFVNLTEREIAETIGISQKGVNKRKAKILEKLKKFLTE